MGRLVGKTGLHHVLGLSLILLRECLGHLGHLDIETIEGQTPSAKA